MNELLKKLTDPHIRPLLFGLTPPSAGISREKLMRINEVRIRRLKALAPDALCIYDVQDESGRSAVRRPYAPRSFMASEAYRDSLRSVSGYRTILYCAPGNLSSTELARLIDSLDNSPLVLVGPPTSRSMVKTSLNEAYRIAAAHEAAPLIGAVCIPERGFPGRDEGERMMFKVDQGVSFFVTQCVYDLPLLQTLLIEYKNRCTWRGIDPPKILFTLSPLRSQKALDFFKWLGISIPEKVGRRLLGAPDTRSESVSFLNESAHDISLLCEDLEIPFGFNIESVMSTKEDFLSAVRLGIGLKLQESRNHARARI